jgi:alpha-mannosidase
MTKGSSKPPLLPYLPWSIEDRVSRNHLRISQAENLLDAIIMLDKGDLPLCTVLQSSDLENLVSLWPDSVENLEQHMQANRLLVGPWFTYPLVPLLSSEALVRNLLIGRYYASFQEQPIAYIGIENMVQQLPQILRASGINTILTDLNEPGMLPVAPSSEDNIVSIINVQLVPIEKSRKYQMKQILDLGLVNRKHKKGDETLHVHTKDTWNLPSARFSFSSRMPVKLENFETEVLLSHWAEPFSAWAAYLASFEHTSNIPRYLREPQAIIAQAWKTLLLNHSYYSVLGMVSDQVQDEMMVRFSQSQQLGRMLKYASLNLLTQQIDTKQSISNPDTTPIVVFNGSQETQTGLVLLNTDYPKDGIEVLDTDGNIIPSSYWESDSSGDPPACFVAVDVPRYGYKTYWIRPSGVASPDIVRDAGNVIENEFVSLSVDAGDGTFSIFDKQTGRLYEGLNQFIDDGDSGTLDRYVKPVQDTIIDVATNTPLSFERIRTPCYETISYLLILRVPFQLTENKSARLPLAAQFVPISISVTVTLTRDVPRADVKVSISNNALDHRLRVFFPFGGRASVIEVEDIFTVRRYPLPQSDVATTDLHEHVFPQQSHVSIRGSDTGLTIANRGIPEISVLTKNSEHALMLTLLRCVSDFHSTSEDQSDRSLVRQSSQCLGEVTTYYSLIPHGTEAIESWKQARCFRVPLETMISDNHDGNLPVQHSLVKVVNDWIVLTAVKPGTRSSTAIVRGYNVSSIEQSVQLFFPMPIQNVMRTDILERVIREVPFNTVENSCEFILAPNEIFTLLVEFSQ